MGPCFYSRSWHYFIVLFYHLPVMFQEIKFSDLIILMIFLLKSIFMNSCNCLDSKVSARIFFWQSRFSSKLSQSKFSTSSFCCQFRLFFRGNRSNWSFDFLFLFFSFFLIKHFKEAIYIFSDYFFETDSFQLLHIVKIILRNFLVMYHL